MTEMDSDLETIHFEHEILLLLLLLLLIDVLESFKKLRLTDLFIESHSTKCLTA